MEASALRTHMPKTPQNQNTISKIQSFSSLHQSHSHGFHLKQYPIVPKSLPLKGIQRGLQLKLSFGRREQCVLMAKCKGSDGEVGKESGGEGGGEGGEGLTYKEAGVDIDAGAELVKRIAKMADGIGGFGGFGGLFPLEFADEPVEDRSFDVKKAADECDLKGTSINLVGVDKEMNNKVGNVLAETLGYYFFDSDSVVEDAADSDPSGKSFRERDEDGFREAESEVLKQLSAMGHLVVSAGNGAVQNATNLGYLRYGITIWIDVPLDMIAMRSNENQSEVFSRLVVTYEEHKSGYATADATVSLQRVAAKTGYFEYDQVTPEDMALEVFVELWKLTRVKKMIEDAGRPF